MKKISLLFIFVLSQAIFSQWQKCNMYDDGFAPRIFSITHKENILFAVGDQCFWVSTDDGVNWHSSTDGLNSRDCPSYAIIEYDGRLFMGAMSYLCISSNNGMSWIKKELGTRVKHIVKKNNFLIISTDKGIFYSEDNGESWIESNYKNQFCHKMLVYKDMIFGGSENGLIQSLDNGRNWEVVDSQLTYTTAFNIKNDTIFIGSNNSIFVSSDTFKTITRIFKGSDFAIIRDIEIYGDMIFISVSSKDDEENKILVSSNNGNNWIEKINGIEELELRSPYSLHIYKNWIFASPAYGGIYKADLSYLTSANNSNLSNKKFSISPNPAKEFIVISLPESFLRMQEFEVRIINILGKCVLSEKIHPITLSYRMNIEHLPSGLYYIHLGAWVGSFVKIE
ncbi:MAG: hypothetical protein N2319_04185 [Candidatus Kapabacteria bacterium]|nr:hypothetical protein [Candidatus Kapabacteria bacterium]